MGFGRTYFCIDMKSFFASVECAERGLNPFETNLVVADESRGKGGICLAITPKMKSLGVKNRCRLFEIPKNMDYIIALPRMKKYIEYAGDIYELYLKYISPEDIHVYSIDEAFIDATAYLKIYNESAISFAKKLVEEIAEKVKVPATVGIGSNLYLAKIALDITAKKSPLHIGILDEKEYINSLWEHKPLTDFWGIGRGTVNRLAKYGITDMKGIAEADEKLLYKIFGINAELLIDHAWGRETCLISDIKAYKTKSKSVSNSQILFEDYDFDKALIVISEMALKACHDVMKRNMLANTVSIGVGYSKDVKSPTGKSVKLKTATDRYSVIVEQVRDMFIKTTYKDVKIRRLMISLGGLCDDCCEGYDFFTDYKRAVKEKECERAVLDIQYKYGKNAVLKGIDLEEGATTKIRNKLIGGHNGGE